VSAFPAIRNRQSGVALVVALLFLLVVTLLAVTAARDSSFSLQMSGNMQDQADSLQSAEATALAVLGLARTGNDPFDGTDTDDPFTGVSPNPLADLTGPGATVDADVALRALDRSCPRGTRSGSGGSSEGLFACDHYHIDAEHLAPSRARARVSLGVIKTVLSSQ